MTTQFKLNKKVFVTGSIKTLTGLHIGGTNSSMGIGGPDSTVIRDPLSNRPLIPGSSLKGKMRSLLEINSGKIGEKVTNQVQNGPTNDPNILASQLFGTAIQVEANRPSRIIVRDAKMKSTEEEFTNTDLPFTETKSEVVIDRITAATTPRQLERVPAGALFDLNLVINVYEDNGKEDDSNNLIRHLFSCMKLVQDDYIGGKGSRGSGKVSFAIESILERTSDYYLGNSSNGENDITKRSEIPEELSVHPFENF